MPLFVFVILMAVVRGLTAALKHPAAKPQHALCEDCAFVHMQYGTSGRNAVFCTFGGAVREAERPLLHRLPEPERGASAGTGRIRSGSPARSSRGVMEEWIVRTAFGIRDPVGGYGILRA